MTSRERVINVLNHKEVDRFPRQVWILPNVSMFKITEFEKFDLKFPPDIISPIMSYGTSRYSMGTPNVVGAYTDEFGSIWNVGEPGVVGEVKEPILNDWSKLDDYKMPMELLTEADLSKVNGSCANTDKFVLAPSLVRPFERMQFMRGTEDLLMDLTSEEPYVYKLAEIIHKFNCINMEMLTQTDVDGISFMDDWGTQISLLISPTMWRKIFKPMYKEYIDIIHKSGKYAFFHSDGFIEDIYPDLVEIGLDALNSQLFCMNIEELVNKFGDKITFWGEIDRQNILPNGKIDDVNSAVDRVAEAVLKKNGVKTGVIAQCEWNAFDPTENVFAVFDRWNKK